MFSLPDKDGYKQVNSGDTSGNIFATFNIDLESDKNKMRIGAQVKKLVTDADNADFDGYAAAIVPFSTNGSTGKIFAVSGKAFSADITDPLGAWTEETAGAEPEVGHTVTDAVVFNNQVIVSDATNLGMWNGSTWINNWWTGTLGAAALTSGQRHLMKVGADGDLYIVDGGNKLYGVDPVTGERVSGNGTLDFSATPYRFTCLAATSTRMWIGCEDLGGDEGVILEWDMSPSSNTVNRIHKIGADAVRCIAVWEDTPFAVLSDGRIKYFNGVAFVSYQVARQNVSFPVASGQTLNEDFIHPNGWAIIDDLPHFLVAGRTGAQVQETSVREANYAMPSGVWCLDPSIGLYHRFALGSGEATQNDYGQMSLVEVGALYALKRNDSKFLASYGYYTDNGTTERSVLAYHDANNTQAGAGFIITPFIYSFDNPLKLLETYHRELPTGAKIRFYQRADDTLLVTREGVWLNQNTLNITATGLGLSKGDIALLKTGAGAGQIRRIDKVETSTAVTSVTFTEANTFATAGDISNVDFLNFKFMGEITSATMDFSKFDIPANERKRKRQFLIEIVQPANKEVVLDYVVIK
jgi:hypothetical protein